MKNTKIAVIGVGYDRDNVVVFDTKSVFDKRLVDSRL